MADLLDEFRGLSSPNQPRCWYTAIELNPEDFEALNQALGVLAITNKAVSLWLKRRGISVAAYSVARHRRVDCSCEHTNRG